MLNLRFRKPVSRQISFFCKIQSQTSFSGKLFTGHSGSRTTLKSKDMYDDFLNYLKNPVVRENEKPKASSLLQLLLTYFLFAIGLGFFAAILAVIAHIKRTPFSFHSKTVEFLYVVMVGPVLEEILFRSWLKFKIINILLFAGVLIFLFLINIGHKPYVVFVTGTLLFVFFSTLHLFKQENIASFIQKHFKFFFYASSLGFGLVHATNFTGHPWLILALSPILAGPQIVLGFLLGYIRMKNGLVYSILLHMLVNTSVLLQLL